MTVAAQAIQTAVQPPPKSMVAAWYGLAVLVTASIFASVDRQILVLVTEPLKHSLQLSDTQIGAMNGIALSLVSGLATFPLGWLADRVDRRTLLAACILIWSVFTAACGLTQTFGQLFACSMGIAIGEAVIGPITYAFIPDLFPPKRWILANYVCYATFAVGYAAALALTGGVIGFVETSHARLPSALGALDPWRVAMLAVAAPGVVLAAMVMLIRLQRRSTATEAEANGGLVHYFREHARTFVGVFVGFGLVASAFGTIGSWIPVVLVREFGQTPAQTGVRLGSVMVVGSVLGVIGSSLLVRMLRPRIGPLTALRVAEIGVIGACLAMPAYLLASAAWQVYVIVGAQVTSTICALSVSPTIQQFMAPRLMRGRVIALGGVIYMLFLSVSPVVVGAVSDLLGPGPRTLLWAVIAVATPCYFLGLGFLRSAERTLPGTFAAVAAD